MLLVSHGEPSLMKALGVDGVCPECRLNRESIKGLAARARRARDAGLACNWVGAEWNLVERTIDDPVLLDTAIELLEEMPKAGISDMLVSCGLRKLSEMSEEDRKTYETRYVKHLGVLYARAQDLGVHVLMHTSLMPGIYLDSVDAWERWIDVFAMESNGILLCTGCTELAGADAGELIDRWLPRIRAIHVRGVTGRFADGSDTEVRLDAGMFDAQALFEKLRAVGYAGPVIPEHFPELPCENSAAVGEAFALGYCRALIQAAARGEKQD